MRAELLSAMNRKKEAADLYNQALGIDPNNAAALNNLAFLNAEAGTNLDQAMSFARTGEATGAEKPRHIRHARLRIPAEESQCASS